MKNLLSLFLIVLSLQLSAQIRIINAGGWLETAYATWEPLNGANAYKVYYSGNNKTDVKIDYQLVRLYNGYVRADVVGLSPGEYTLKIVPVMQNGENNSLSTTTSTLQVIAHKREGFAFKSANIPGAYNNDGTLKPNANVLYVDNNNAKTLNMEIIVDKKGTKQTFTGIANILNNKAKGFDRRPLAVRFIGQINKQSLDVVKDNMYLDMQGSKGLAEANENDRGPLMYTTIEGIGEDATFYGFGLNFKRTAYIEVRNLAFMLWGGGGDGDAVSMDTDNQYIWIHNNDFFYGQTGKDADQTKGDGTIDMKYNSSFISISFNHFWDAGKAMGCGGATGEDVQLQMSFFNNWFNHSDSRMPRLTSTNAHIYNNYYDGVSVYGVGTSRFSSALVEQNYFRGTYRPILIPGQGTDIWEGAAKGFTGSSFTAQDGGMNKAYSNIMQGGNANNALSYFTQLNTPTVGQIDAYEVDNNSITVPATVAARRGGYLHNNFDTNPALFYSYNAETAEQARTTVINFAGRLKGGDFKWTFDNTVEDGNSAVIPALKTALNNYTTTLLAIQSENGLVSSTQNITSAEFSIFPNPTTDAVHIKTNHEIGEIILMTVTGVRLRTYTNTKTISLGHLPSGIYHIGIQTKNGMVLKTVSRL